MGLKQGLNLALVKICANIRVPTCFAATHLATFHTFCKFLKSFIMFWYIVCVLVCFGMFLVHFMLILGCFVHLVPFWKVIERFNFYLFICYIFVHFDIFDRVFNGFYLTFTICAFTHSGMA